MKTNGHISRLTLAVLLLGGLVACREEEPLPDENGVGTAEEVVFNPSTVYDNGDGTRTEFSGVVVGGGTLSGSQEQVERIDWLTGDPMTILYQRGNSVTQADYEVTSVTAPQADDSESRAVIAPKSQGLTWGAGNSHVFCAVYPSAGYGGTSTSLTRNNQGQFIAGGAVPATQMLTLRTVNNTDKYLPDMKYALMVAYQSVQSAASAVFLPFSPAVTAFELAFKRADDDDSYLIREIRIHSGSGSVSGAYTVRVTGASGNKTSWDNLSVNNGGTDLTLTFDTDGNGVADDIELNSASETSFTAFAVPGALSQVTLQLVFANGTVRDLPLKTNNVWETFQPGRKYRITNYKVPTVVGGWSYIVEEIPDYVCSGHTAVSGIARTVTSYRYSAIHPGTKESIPWKLQYSADGNTWTNVSGTGALGQTNFTVSALSGTGFTLGITGTSTAVTEPQSIESIDIAEMAARTPFTSGGSYFDLSKHASWGLLDDSAPVETPRNTANCYVVSRPGSYEFPCVYGNAIANGETNYASFAPGDANSAVKGVESKVTDSYQSIVHWATHFRNAKNTDITDPWIVPDLGATGLTAEVLAGSDIVSGASVADGTGGKYIRFSVASGNIKPGNVVIALKGTIPGRSGSEILWSWHIWVTNKDLTPVTIGGKRMMDWNLGWADTPNVFRSRYPDRSLRFRVVQVDGNGTVISGSDTEPFTVTQEGDASYASANPGSNPYYQWGRKDPLAADAAVDVLTYRPFTKYSVSDSWDDYIRACEGYVSGLDAGYGTDANYGYGIRNPRKAVTNSYTSGWVGGPVVPANLYVSYYMYGNNGPFYDLVGGDVPISSCIYYYVPYYEPNPAQIFNLSGFTYGGMFSFPNTYATYVNERKTVSAVSYNLWNAYCWADSDFRSESQVYKTVYDPCPPGFTVPSRGSFDQTGTPGNAPGGVLLDGHFFPFTGVRSWNSYLKSGSQTLAVDVYHWTHDVTLDQPATGSAGYLWTAQREEVGAVTTANFNRDNHYVGYAGARIMSYGTGSVTLPASNVYTMGSAASVRPMLDPRYAASLKGLVGGLEDVEYGTLPRN